MKKDQTPSFKKTVYMVPYYWEGRVKFLRFNADNYKDALRLAECCFGKNAAQYLYKKEFIVKE